MSSNLEPQDNALDINTLKRAFGTFPTGVTIVTAHTEDGPVGFTCQAFNALSLEPPLISLSVMRTSSSYPLIRKRGRFAVNVLRDGQHELALKFGTRTLDRWQDVEWSADEGGSPRVGGSIASFDCELWAEHEAGDHLIVLGKVIRIHLPDGDSPADPLVYNRSTFRHLTPPRGQSLADAARQAARAAEETKKNTTEETHG